jgi:hypothetical protein
MQQCSDQFIMTAWRPLSETHGWSRYNTFYSWGVLEWSDVGYWCSNTLHSRWVKSIRVIRRGLLMFQYSPLEMSEEYQRVIRRGLLMFQYSPLEMSEEYQRVIRCGLLMFQYSPLEMSEEYQRVIRRGLLTMNEDLFRYTSISLSQPLTCLLISCFIE